MHSNLLISKLNFKASTKCDPKLFEHLFALRDHATVLNDTPCSTELASNLTSTFRQQTLTSSARHTCLQPNLWNVKWKKSVIPKRLKKEKNEWWTRNTIDSFKTSIAWIRKNGKQIDWFIYSIVEYCWWILLIIGYYWLLLFSSDSFGYEKE